MAYPIEKEAEIPAVEIDLSTRIVKRDLNASVAEIQKTIHGTAGTAGRDFSREFQDKLNLDPARKLDTRGFRTQGAKARREFREGFGRNPLADITASVDRDGRTMQRSMQTATESAVNLGNTLAGLGRVAGPAGLAMAAVAAHQLASAATAAAGAIALLPAVVGTAAAGIGTLVIGMQGFGDAVENMGDADKFAESLRKLAPSAQQAAVTIKSLVDGPLKELQRATQGALFDGVGPALQQLSTTLTPTLQRLTTTVAGSLNEMFHGALAGIDPTVFSSITTNIGQAFQNLAPAIQPLTSALLNLVDVGASFLPDLATGAANAAQAFADLVRNAAETGQLQDWIQSSLDVLGLLGDAVSAATEMFMALSTDGVSAMQNIVTSVELVSSVVRIATGDLTAMRDLFPSIGEVAAGAFADIANSIDTFLLGPLRAAIDLINKIPGVDIGNIPEFSMNSQGFTISGRTEYGPSTQGGGPNASRERRGLPPAFGGGGGSFNGLPGMPGGTLPVPGGIGNRVGSILGEISQWSGRQVPGSAGAGGGGGSSAGGPAMPVVPRPGTDPTSLLQPGMPITSAAYSAASNVLDAQHRVEQERAELNALIASNVATEDQLTAARNEVAEAERAEIEARMRLAEQQQQATEKMTSGMASASQSFAEIGAGLDADLGFSKGLPGLADNLVRFLASLAAAPIMGMLAPIANGAQGSGILGMMGYGADQSAAGYTGNGYGYQSVHPNVAAMMNLAQSADGGAYKWGASDLANGLADCSGAVSDLVEILTTGEAGPGRLFSTADFEQYAAANGWQRGVGGPGSLSVGVRHGGPGGGHTAATLPNGVNFESGGAHGGIAYGGQAAGASSFPNAWHLPVTQGGFPAGAPTPSALAPSLAMPAPGAYLSPAMANPALSPGLPAPGTVPTGGPLASGFPTAFGAGSPQTASYAPTTPSEQAAPAWQPQGGGQLGSGFLQMAMGLASGAAGMGANMFAPGSGAAAQAAADMAMKALNRTIAYGGQAAGIGMQGLMETFGVSDPDGGTNGLGTSWLQRIAGGLSGMKPAGGQGAGKQDQNSKVDPRNPQNQQQGQPGQPGAPGQPGGQRPGGPTVHIENFVQAENRNGLQTANDLAYQTASA